LRLFRPQTFIVHGLQRFVPSGVVIARVILPAQRGLIRELIGLDEVDPAQLGRVHVQLDGQYLDHPFDEIRSLGHPERTTIGNTARCLVGVNPIHSQISSWDVI
jgi:hypothetical protein